MSKAHGATSPSERGLLLLTLQALLALVYWLLALRLTKAILLAL
jgi:hypothetical protein